MANEFVARRGIIAQTGGAQITGSLLVSGAINATGYGVTAQSFTGSFSGSLSTADSASYVQWNAIDNTPSGIVSSSGQVSYTGLSSIPVGIVSSSTQVTANLPSGVVSSSSQVDVRSTTGIATLATTGSNTFVGTQNIQGQVSASGFTGSFSGDGSGLTGVASTLGVTGSTGTGTVNLKTQALTITGGTGISTNASGQTVTISTIAGTVSSSAQIIDALPGVVSSSGQIDYNSIANKLSGTISSSAQFNALSGTSASFATTASAAITATTATSASFATTASAATSITFIPQTASFASTVNLNTITGTTFSNAAFYFPQDVRVEGTLTAQQVQTEYVSSSIIYESGSTKFGDTADDVMSVTGSLRVLGTISGSMVGMFSSSGQVDYNSIQNKISGAVSSSASGDAQGQIKLNGVNVNITTLQSTSAPSFAAVTAATGFYSGSSVAGIAGPVSNQVVSTVPCASGTAVFFDYAINDTTNYRTGTVMVVSNGTAVEYTDTSTNDIGNTAQAIFAVDILSSLIRLKFTNTSGTWTVKTAIRAL